MEEHKIERAVLAGLSADCFKPAEQATEQTLDELEALLETAGGVCVAKVLQNRHAPDPHSFVGEGKAQEIQDLLRLHEADMVVFDNDLSPSQIRALEDITGATVLDRSALILDIFAQRAKTAEGRLQVELAQLRYRSSRLTGMRKSLSRLGGGIGTRGPGEKKLEMDRRLIKDRIAWLNRQLKEVVQNRDTMRKQRSRNHTPTVAIVGYTNAGKSTLLNALTDAGILSEDKLFATLDPTTRGLELENGQKILFTDTVGFISKLPHPLIRAFRSTLEEAKYADMILHVVDVSNEHYEMQMEVVYDTLRELEIGDKKVLTAFNKIDRIQEDDQTVYKDPHSDQTVYISAREKKGLDTLLEKTEEILNEGMIYLEKVFSYEEAGKIQQIRQHGKLESEEYTEEGIAVKAYIPPFLNM